MNTEDSDLSFGINHQKEIIIHRVIINIIIHRVIPKIPYFMPPLNLCLHLTKSTKNEENGKWRYWPEWQLSWINNGTIDYGSVC